LPWLQAIRVTCRAESEKWVQDVTGNTWWEEDNLGDVGVVGSNIKIYLKEVGCDDVDWVHLI